MQKIFIVTEDRRTNNQDGNTSYVNEFIKDGGFVVSVTPQKTTHESNGRWLVVADDGQSNKL